MASATGGPTAEAPPPASKGPENSLRAPSARQAAARSRDRAARGKHHRRDDRHGDLLLREHEQLLHGRQLQDAAAVFRAVCDPRGGRDLRDDPWRDRPLDRGHVPVRPDPVLQAQLEPRPGAGPRCDRDAAGVHGRWRAQRLLRRRRRDQLVRRDAGDAVRVRGARADHLSRHARRPRPADSITLPNARHVRRRSSAVAPTRSSSGRWGSW